MLNVDVNFFWMLQCPILDLPGPSYTYDVKPKKNTPATCQYRMTKCNSPVNFTLVKSMTTEQEIERNSTFQKILNDFAPHWPIVEPQYKRLYVVKTTSDENWRRGFFKFYANDNQPVFNLVDTGTVENISRAKWVFFPFIYI